MTNHFQTIGDDLRGYYVETIWASSMVWIVPGTYPEDPAFSLERELTRQAYLAQWKTWSDLEREGVV